MLNVNNSIYSNKLRVRVLGLLKKDEKLLLVKLYSPVTKQDIWTPPGGGVEFGESLHEALKREFKEETGLVVEVKDLVRINELIESPFHAIEFYFQVEKVSGKLVLGYDPEHENGAQILKEIGFFNISELLKMEVKPEFIKHDSDFSNGNSLF